jgi:hypothetical protein
MAQTAHAAVLATRRARPRHAACIASPSCQQGRTLSPLAAATRRPTSAPLPAGLGGAPAPKTDLHRFVKWPKYVRIQRQRRVLSMRLKVPPQINQFVTRALDKNQAETLFKLMLKYRPEDKKEKKDRLKTEAEARAAGGCPTLPGCVWGGGGRWSGGGGGRCAALLAAVRRVRWQAAGVLCAPAAAAAAAQLMLPAQHQRQPMTLLKAPAQQWHRCHRLPAGCPPPPPPTLPHPPTLRHDVALASVFAHLAMTPRVASAPGPSRDPAALAGAPAPAMTPALGLS